MSLVALLHAFNNQFANRDLSEYQDIPSGNHNQLSRDLPITGSFQKVPYILLTSVPFR
jgi:hypothetical protein